MHSLQSGTKSQLKKQSHLKSPVKLKVSPKIKFPVHSHLEYIWVISGQFGHQYTDFEHI